MKIKINGKTFQVSEYDDDRSILQTYAVSIGGEGVGSLPSFFRIESRSVDGTTLVVSDVRDILKVNSIDLLEPTFIPSVLSKYPRLQRSDIGPLWAITNYQIKDGKLESPVTSDDLTNLKKLDRSTFFSIASATKAVTEFIKHVDRSRKDLEAKIKQEKAIFNALNKYEETPINKFVLEEVISHYILKLPDGDGLFDIFDAMDVSKNIPFILISYKRRLFYKVFKTFTLPHSWINFTPEHEGIYFKIISAPTSKLSIRHLKIENLYSDGYWSPNNIVEINFRIKEGIKEDIETRVFSVLGDRIKYEIVTTRQLAIKGTFLVPEIDFDPMAFADLLVTNPTLDHFLFVNEKNMTILNKDRFRVYYSPNQKGVLSQSLALTIIPTETLNSIIVRVSHASNVQQADVVRRVMARLFSIYISKKKEVLDFYTKILGKVQKKPEKKAKEDKKTGPRAVALRKLNPDMFGSRYPDQCQKEKQPYILESEAAAKKIKQLKDDPHKIMTFTAPLGNEMVTSVYACDPRESNDKNFVHLFPGLKINNPKTQNEENDKEYKEKYPRLPCCYKQDQYIKKVSQLREYVLEKVAAPTKGYSYKTGASYIVGPNRRLEPDRMGEMPFNWEKILNHIGIDKISKGKRELYPILRYGVVSTPDSFLHCMERATNKAYINMNMETRKRRVADVRKDLAGANFNVAKQELYDRTDAEIEEALRDEQQYLAPEEYISLVENHYACNIFIYVVDNEHPNCEIVLPRYSRAYLPRQIDSTRNTVLIIKYDAKSEGYPYQCDIVTEVTMQDNKIAKYNFLFKRHPISDAAINMSLDSNEVFIISSKSYEVYQPVLEVE